MLKKTSKLLAWVLGTILLLVGGFLLYATLTDYKPEEKITLDIVNNQTPIVKEGQPITITTFNIGYAGLDKNQDFFMDGGSMSRSSSEEQTRQNLKNISTFLKKAASDIYLLQEVDQASTRSYKIDQVSYIRKELPSYSSVYATNYKVSWVPVPLLEPMGAAHSGLLTLSTFHSTESYRYDLPGKESWPVQQFELDRAFTESRFPVQNGKELVVLNLHLSAYDKGGSIRKQQLGYLASYIEQEDRKGNYLIIGGDWNHMLPGTNAEAFPATQAWPEWLQTFPEDFQPEGYSWAVDAQLPTVRTIDIPYTEGINFRAVIDGFLVSSNVEVLSVEAWDLKYENSDHNPVTAEFILK